MRLLKRKLLLITLVLSLLSASVKLVDAEELSSLGNWVSVSNLEEGDLLKTEGGWVKIESIEYIRELVTVYNLSVSEPNTFFSNGILAHNKDTCPLNHTIYGLPFGQTASIVC